MQALTGLNVLDLSTEVVGPYCTMLLALFGADVLKVEPPRHGDPLRHVGPFAGDRPGPDRSLPFLAVNAGKRSVTLDPSCTSGRDLALALVRTSDVVVESFPPGTLADWGLGYDVLTAVRPGLILLSVTPFGQTGPYRRRPWSELVVYAMGHEMYATGLPEREPLAVAPWVSLTFAGETAAVAVMAAVLGQRLTREGEWIDFAIMESFLSSMDRRADSLLAYAYSGEKATRRWSVMAENVPPTYNQTADGYLHLSVGSSEGWRRLLAVLTREDERFSAFADRPEQETEQEAFLALWQTFCRGRGKRELADLLQAGGLPAAPVHELTDLFEDPQLTARGFFHAAAHSELGSYLVPGLPFRLSATPGEAKGAVPRLGQDNATVYGALGFGAEDLARLYSAGVI